MEELRDKVLKQIYFTPNSGGSFGGARKLWLETRKIIPELKLEDVKKWLQNYETYTLFKTVKRKFPRLKVLVDNIDEQWQIDLLDLTSFSKTNNGVRYLLVIIDVLSRFAWVRALKTKDAQSVVDAMKDVFKKKRIPTKIQSDMGKEFVNKHF